MTSVTSPPESRSPASRPRRRRRPPGRCRIARSSRRSSGLMLGMFVTILASTIVSNALPRIIADLGGSQSVYTWIVTTELLAMTATVPLWGKMADLYSKKLLIHVTATRRIRR